MTQPHTSSDTSAAWSGPVAGPSLSFAFNLAKIPGQGEDSDPILRDGPDLGLAGVFDGMGGAGGTVYETDEGPRTGAYLASRIARDVVESRMLELLEPDWNLHGTTTAEDLRRSVRQALEERLVELKAPASRLRSRLLRALPTTMALVALQRTHRDASGWVCHVFWAGDSRAYVCTADGLQQLHPDDLREPGDALSNLRHDSVVSNAMSADTDFAVNYRRVDLKAPFLIVCATDGCFGYVPTPMHFEQLVLAPLPTAESVDAWSAAVQEQITAVTGDDAAMAVLGVGADLAGFRELFTRRVATLGEEYVAPLDELADAVRAAEEALTQARTRQVDETQSRWERYRTNYERSLRMPEQDRPQVRKWWHEYDESPPGDSVAALDPSGPPSADSAADRFGAVDKVTSDPNEGDVAGAGQAEQTAGENVR